MGNPLDHDWTDERKARLVALWTEGRSAAQIARALGGVSRNAVLGKLHRLGIKRGRASSPAGVRPKPPTAPRLVAPAGATRSQAVRDGLTTFNLIRKAAHPPLPLPPLREIAAPHARPWLTRRFGECDWPVRGDGAEVWSCCAPVFRAGWCRGHHAIGREAPKVPVGALERLIRRAG